jgi:hypothetical protein
MMLLAPVDLKKSMRRASLMASGLIGSGFMVVLLICGCSPTR